MSEFRFKRFSVSNEDSPLKVGTDGVLLGAIASIDRSDRRIFDIGTGTGVISLMLAQRFSDIGAKIAVEAIDIDEAAAAEAGRNFEASPWKEMLKAERCALSEFIPKEKYDLIVSNPPYFDDSLRNPSQRRSEARHTVSLSHSDIASFAAANLSEGGRLSLVLPADLEKGVSRTLRSFGLFPFRTTRVRTTMQKLPSRIIIESSRIRKEEVEEKEIVLMNEGKYTEGYLELMKDFYLFA